MSRHTDKYMASMLVNDFEKWESTVEFFLNEIDKKESEFESYACDFDILTNARYRSIYDDVVLLQDEIEKYAELEQRRYTLCSEPE